MPQSLKLENASVPDLYQRSDEENINNLSQSYGSENHLHMEIGNLGTD